MIRAYHTNFEYCRKCGHTWESVTPDDDENLPKCPKCYEQEENLMNNFIDHTSLKVTTGIRQLCAEAEEYKFRGVCIFPDRIKEARRLFYGKISCVIGFPYGNNQTKVDAAKCAAQNGVDEIDVVMHITAFKHKIYLKVLEELTKIVKIGPPIKVIVEEHYLDIDELKIAHQIVKDSGAFCVKTSTGVVSGATLETVRLWKELGDLKIKASGNIRTSLECREFIEAGSDIIGTSNGVQIMAEINGWEDEKVNK